MNLKNFMETGFIMFHQGYTDILNSLPLVNYYSKKYKKLFLICREDFKDTVLFYLKNLTNVNVIFLKMDLIRKNYNPFMMTQINEPVDTLFHGSYDVFRNDKYAFKFNDSIFYGHGFYEFYDIPLINKIDYFEVERNLDGEKNLYSKIIGDENCEYIVYHENNDDKVIKDKNIKYVNLDNLCLNLFDSIKILKKSKEIHLVDSVWASFCYLLDSKYQIFSETTIYLYPFKNRGGGCIWNRYNTELKPFKPKNWILK